MLAALDLTTGKITYRICHSKRWPQILGADPQLGRHPSRRNPLLKHRRGLQTDLFTAGPIRSGQTAITRVPHDLSRVPSREKITPTRRQ
jgi:hypothetical protein